MKVQIEENLYIESDSQQFILKEYTGKQSIKDGVATDLFKTHGYFSTLESALNKFTKMKIMESTASNLSELIADVKSIRSYIESEITF